MVGTFIKQPNEKYCIVGNGGEIKHYNLTEQDIIDMYIEAAKGRIKTAEHYGNLIEKTVKTYTFGNDISPISDDVLIEMGFDKPYNELVKFVPRKPINTSYAGRDFTTYGKCPNCGGSVQDGMCGSDKKCRKCGQILKW